MWANCCNVSHTQNGFGITNYKLTVSEELQRAPLSRYICNCTCYNCPDLLTYSTWLRGAVGYEGVFVWLSVTHDSKQLWNFGRATLAVLNTDERSTDPQDEERIDDD